MKKENYASAPVANGGGEPETPHNAAGGPEVRGDGEVNAPQEAVGGGAESVYGAPGNAAATSQDDAERRKKEKTTWAFFLVGCICVALPLLAGITPIISFAYPIITMALNLVGVVFGVIALVRSVRLFGKNRLIMTAMIALVVIAGLSLIQAGIRDFIYLFDTYEDGYRYFF